MIKNFSPEEVTVMFAEEILNVRSFKVDVKVERKQNHVCGRRGPYDYTASKETYEGSITMPYTEHLRIIRSLPPGSKPTDIEGISIVTLLVQGENAITTVYEDVSVSGYGEEFKMDAGSEDVTYTLLIGGILITA